MVGIPFFDGYVEKDYLDRAAGSAEPFFMSVNFMKVHQPNLPATDYIHKSLSKSKYADSVVELDARIGRIMDKVRALGLDQKTLVFYTTDNGAWQDVYPGQDPGREEEPRHRRWPGPHGDVRRRRRHQAAGEGSQRRADHLRQLRHVTGPVRHGQSRRGRPGSTSPRTS
ncbi:MAG: arylsulfatase [Thermomicrobiales bacterium]|nr:arylsulfatase [Thermomicrobiales bacterium]